MAAVAAAPLPAAAPAEVSEEPEERPPHVPLPPLDPEMLAMPPEEYWVSDLRWIQPGQLCVVRAPRNKDHLDSLVRENVAHLVTLSPDTMPKPEDFPKSIKSTIIPVEEFDMPTDESVDQFIDLCEKALKKKEVSGDYFDTIEHKRTERWYPPCWSSLQMFGPESISSH